MPSPYLALLNVATSNKETGVADYFLFAPKKDFDVIATPTVAGDTHISADHTFTTGLGFMRVTCAPAKQKLASQFVGEAGNLKMVEKFEVFIPGSNKELHKFFHLVKNDQLILLVPDAECEEEKYYQLGCDCVSAYLAPEGGWESGTTKEGVKGYKATFEYPTGKVLTYEGAITLHP